MKQAARSLWRTPGSTMAAVGILAVGIAVTTAMFTLVHSLLLRPLPFPEADRLAAVAGPVSWGDVLRWEEHARTVAAAGVYRKRTWAFTDKTHAPVEVVLAGMTSRGFWEALQLAPARGVGFAPEMELPGANREIWLTDEFWRRRYRAADVMGDVVALNDVEYRVTGVLPAGFHFPMEGENPDVYIPLDRADYCCQRDSRGLAGVVRLQPGVTRGAGAGELAALAETPVRLEDLRTALLGDRTEPLLLLALASGLLMVVAAANAAAIRLGRAARELRDAAVKASLGATTGDLARELVWQGLLMGMLAAGSGVALAAAVLRGAERIPAVGEALAGYAQIGAIRMDWRVVCFAVTVAMCAALAATLTPIGLLRSARLEGLLRSGGRVRAGQPLRGRTILVVCQVALSTLLLCLGGLVLDHLREVLTAKKGFRTEQVVLAGVGIPEARYDTDEKMVRFHERVIENLRRIPGVVAASGAVGLPLGQTAAFLPDGVQLPKKDRPRAVVGVASPGMFTLLGIPLVAGRGFRSSDRTGHPWVAVVNRSFAEKYGKRVGARFPVGFWNGHMAPWTRFEVIGVVGDAENQQIGLPPAPAIYLCALQVPLEGFLYFARTSLPSAELTTAFRKAVWDVDREIEAIHPQPLAPYVERDLQSRKLTLNLLGGFGGLALVLAGAGLAAGVSAYVTASWKEFAIRAALGEAPGELRTRVVQRGFGMTGWGVLAGLAGAEVAGRLAGGRMAGFGAPGALPMSAVVLVMAVAAGVASWPPARRAARMDPAEVLRRD